MADWITKVEPIVVRIPLDDGGLGRGITPSRWRNQGVVLVRVETQSGIVGYGCQNATAVAVRDLVAPVVIGRDSCGLAAPHPVGRVIEIPDTPGIGFEPDMEVI